MNYEQRSSNEDVKSELDSLKSAMEKVELICNDLKAENVALKASMQQIEQKNHDLQSDVQQLNSIQNVYLRLKVDNWEHKSVGSNLLEETPKSSGFSNVIVLGYFYCHYGIINICRGKEELEHETLERYIENNGQLCKIEDAETKVNYYANYVKDFSEEQWNAVQLIINDNQKTKIVFFFEIIIDDNGSILKDDYYHEKIKFAKSYTNKMKTFSFVFRVWKQNAGSYVSDYTHTSEDEQLVREALINDFEAPPQTSVMILDTKDWQNVFFPETAETRQQIKDFVDGCPPL